MSMSGSTCCLSRTLDRQGHAVGHLRTQRRGVVGEYPAKRIEDFLRNEWQNGALLGDKPEKAYFVRCDRSTMSQNDLDNERLVCLVGVAPLKPTEFVIFRIGQWTADRKD